MMTQDIVQQALADYRDPYTDQTLAQAKVIKSIEIDSARVAVSLDWHYPVAGIKAQIQSELEKILLAIPGVDQATVTINTRVISHTVQNNLQPLPNVKNIIAIASGKGGVGKSTTTVNLALAMQAEGARVGILDADIYGPSQPHMLGGERAPHSHDKKTLEPVEQHGVQSMSIGYLIASDEQPMAWRGPMVSGALQQLLRDTHWDNLDYLFIDLPPGTGDIQLTLSQKIPVSAGVIVTTPQDIALLDAKKALQFFRKVRIPVLGIIENMSLHVCAQCGHQEAIFSEGGGEQLSVQYDVPLLAKLPLNKVIREHTDLGTSIITEKPESDITKIYRDAARQLAASLSLQAKDYQSKFPKIVVT